MEITEEQFIRGKIELRRRNESLSIDRLPDEVLTHILSFLPTKTAAATSILAKRWRFLWLFVPNLDFHSDNQYAINSVLLLHQLQTINSFRIYLDEDFSERDYQIQTWIIAAVARNVQKLHLNCVLNNFLPLRLFTCKTLADLALDKCGVIPRFSNPCLPRLKKLRLICVMYEGDDSLPNLLSGCPVLEELLIGYIMDEDLVCCKISSPSVKRLTVNFEFSDESDGESYNHDYCMEINTPALEYLNMVDRLSERIQSRDLTSLVQASFTPSNNNEKQDDALYCASVFEFIKKLSNVESLTLNLQYLGVVLESVFSAWAISFNYLTKLELYADCHFLVKFLESARNLQMLTFWQDSIRWRDWREPQQVPTCVLSRLKTIRLLEVGGVEYDFEIVRYLLRNAQVLEAMGIHFSHQLSPEGKNHMLGEIALLALLERGSVTCEVFEIV